MTENYIDLKHNILINSDFFIKKGFYAISGGLLISFFGEIQEIEMLYYRQRETNTDKSILIKNEE
jgi:hypothetical protein